MKRQKHEPGNFSEKPGEQGGQEEGSRAPKGGSSEKGPGSGSGEAPRRRRSRRGGRRRLRTDELKRRHGESKGFNRPVEEELRRRGHNTKMLAQVEWDHDQKRWREISKQAHEISRRRKRGAKSAKQTRKRKERREQTREQTRQNRIDLLARLKAGVVIVGRNYDPSAADGSCPF
jgi:hypothetical protein